MQRRWMPMWMPMLIRRGLACVVVVGASATAAAVGCGGDDSKASSSTPDGSTAAGPDGSTGASDSAAPTGDGSTSPEGGGTDSSVPGEGGGGSGHAKMIFVHASPDAPPIRYCLATGDGTSGGAVNVIEAPAFPDDATSGLSSNFPIAGQFPGYGGPAPDPGVDLSTSAVSVYALGASSIRGQVAGGTELGCQELIGPHALGAADSPAGTLAASSAFWFVGSVPEGALADGTSWLLAVVGCLPGETSGAADCPSDYDASTGDLALRSWALDNTTVVPAGSVGGQFAHLSPSFDAFLASRGATTTAAGFTQQTTSAGLDGALITTIERSPIESMSQFGDLAPSKLATVAGLDFDGGNGFYALGVLPDGGAGSGESQPFSFVEQLSWGASVPAAGVVGDGSGFVFLLVGNPNVSTPYVDALDGGNSTRDAGIYNGHQLHFLVFPTDPPYASP